VSELEVDAEFRPALEALRELLADAPDEVEVGEDTYRISTIAELEEAQHGYRVNPLTGDDLTGDGSGDWRRSWVTVGWEADLGDPLFVDLARADLPVFTAMHGGGSWEPEPVALSLASLLRT